MGLIILIGAHKLTSSCLFDTSCAFLQRSFPRRRSGSYTCTTAKKDIFNRVSSISWAAATNCSTSITSQLARNNLKLHRVASLLISTSHQHFSSALLISTSHQHFSSALLLNTSYILLSLPWLAECLASPCAMGSHWGAPDWPLCWNTAVMINLDY